MNSNLSIQERTKKLAIRVIKAYSKITENQNFDAASVILAKQFLRSGTSIGANCKEAISAQSNKDFINKYQIALNYLIQKNNNKQQQQRRIFFTWCNYNLLHKFISTA